MAFSFVNKFSARGWAAQKIGRRVSYEEVPNTARGYEKNRAYIVDGLYNHKYFLSTNNDRDYFINCEECGGFSVWYSVDGDNITIEHATQGGRHYSAPRMLKKYAAVVIFCAAAVKYDGAVVYGYVAPAADDIANRHFAEIDAWIAGYKVRGFKWLDGKNYYLHVELYAPGASLSRPPLREKSALIPLEEWEQKKEFVHSIVSGLMTF